MSRNLPNVTRHCRTCIYWDKPIGRRSIADHCYPCTAPAPLMEDFPASIVGTLDRRPMERDDGSECPVWTPLETGSGR